LLLEWWEDMSGKRLFYLFCFVCYTGYGVTDVVFVIFMVTTLFTKRSKICWILTLVYENFDYSSIRICSV